jgi:endonuclease III
MIERADRDCAICPLLEEAYTQPNLGNYADLVDELIYILLSTMTTKINYQWFYAALRGRFSTWQVVLEAYADEVEAAISALCRAGARPA